MKRILFFLIAAMALASCNKDDILEPVAGSELTIVPLNPNAGPSTRGYVEGANFVETYYDAIHAVQKDSTN